jgi:tripartite-type tricarboxylate transporter receptor subunit TctC
MIRSFLVAAGVLAAAVPAQAQKISDRTVTIVVPTSAGTGLDILARLVAEDLKQRWGQTVVVENKAGASHSIGIQAVTRAEPDGHTLLLAANTLTTNVGSFKTLPYDPVKSLAPIAKLATGQLALTVHSAFPPKTLQEFVAHAKARPGEINYASTGPGTPQHLAMELLKLNTGIKLTHVPYPGSAGASRELVGGFVSVMFMPLHQALPLVQSGKLRLLAVSGARRNPQMPDVPTLDEAGFTGLEVDSWYGLLATGGTPPDIVDRYNKAVNEMLQTAAIRNALAHHGLAPAGGTPGEFGKLIVEDLARWTRVVKDAGIAVKN